MRPPAATHQKAEIVFRTLAEETLQKVNKN